MNSKIERLKCETLSSISVVIPTKDRYPKLIKCLESIVQSANKYIEYAANVEIIVIDQSNVKENVVISQGGSNIPIRIICPPFIGVSRARNLGIRNAHHELLAFTDDDCIVHTDWLEEIGRFFSNRPDADALFGHTEAIPRCDVKYWHEIQPNPFGWDWHGHAQNGDRCFATILRKGTEQFSGRCLPYAQFGSSNNMACTLKTLRSSGLFSVWLGAGSIGISAEDTELQYRMLLHGKSIYYSDRVRIWHDNWQAVFHAEEQLLKYLSGVTAVFVHFSLSGDLFAIMVSINCLKNVFKVRTFSNKLRRFKSFWVGLANGITLHRKISEYPTIEIDSLNITRSCDGP